MRQGGDGLRREGGTYMTEAATPPKLGAIVLQSGFWPAEHQQTATPNSTGQRTYDSSSTTTAAFEMHARWMAECGVNLR